MTLDHTPTTEDFAENWATMLPGDRARTFSAMPREEADDFFLEMSTWDQAELL
jgi:hypothetical protein